MNKIFIFPLIAVIIGVIFLSVYSISQNDDYEEPLPVGLEKTEEQKDEPKGRDLSVQLDEKMGFSAP